MQNIKNIYLVAWKNRKFFDSRESPIGSIMLPDNNNQFFDIWRSLKFGEYDNFEQSKDRLGPFSGGIIKESNPYQQTLTSDEGTFFEEEFGLLTSLKKSTELSMQIEVDAERLAGYRFYVIESEDVEKGIIAYHFARFIPKYHILVNKKIISTKAIIVSEVDKMKPNKSMFSLESLILIEPSIFASAIYNLDDSKIKSIQMYIHNPDAYEKAFILKDSYFKYAKGKFLSFMDVNPETKRTISQDQTEVFWEPSEFNPNAFFDNKNVNLAKKFARDTDDDKEYPINRIREANEKLGNSKKKNNYEPLEFIEKGSGEVRIKVTEKSVGTLAAIMDGQIWTNEIHQETQTNI